MSQTAEVEEEIQLVEKKAVLEEGPTENEKETIAAFQAEAESQEMEEEAAPAVAASAKVRQEHSLLTGSRTHIPESRNTRRLSQNLLLDERRTGEGKRRRRTQGEEKKR